MKTKLLVIFSTFVLWHFIVPCDANRKVTIRLSKERNSIPSECVYRGTQYEWVLNNRNFIKGRAMIVMNITTMFTNTKDKLKISGIPVSHDSPSCYIFTKTVGSGLFKICPPPITSDDNLEHCKYECLKRNGALSVIYQTEDETVSNDELNIEYQVLKRGKQLTTSKITGHSMNCRRIAGPQILNEMPLPNSEKEPLNTTISDTVINATFSKFNMEKSDTTRQSEKTTEDTTKHDDTGIHLALIVAIVVSVLLLVALGFLVGCLCSRRRRRVKPMRSNALRQRPIEISFQEPSFIDPYHYETISKVSTFVASPTRNQSDIAAVIFDDSFNESVFTDSEFSQSNAYENMPSSDDPRYVNATTDITRDRSMKYASMMSLRPQYLEMNSLGHGRIDEKTYQSIKREDEYQNTFTSSTKL